MKSKIGSICVRMAFTLVEVLTVLAIIALVIGILVPGLNTARRRATDIKQRGEIHNMEVALELFKNDYGAYPESRRSVLGKPICGSQNFTEALVGRDLKGFDPKSTWWTNPAAEVAAGVYATTQPLSTNSLNRRKGPYYKLDYCGAYLPEQIYGTYDGAGYNYDNGKIYSSSASKVYRAPLITDLYKSKKIYLETGKTVHTGTPILYFKANVADKTSVKRISEIYDIGDNNDLIKMGTIDNGTKHYFDEGRITNVKDPNDPSQTIPLNGIEYFNYVITNPKIETFDKPYNAESFILMSAGDDGMFGTADDITNLGD